MRDDDDDDDDDDYDDDDDDDDNDDDDDDDEWCAFPHSTFGELQKTCNPSTIQARSNVRVAPNFFRLGPMMFHGKPQRDKGNPHIWEMGQNPGT